MAWPRGTPCPEEVKEKLSSALSGKNNPNYGKTGKNSPLYGKKFSAEHKAKMSENHANVAGENNPMHGKHHSPEACEKISAGLKGRTLSAVHREKLSQRIISQETRRKIAESRTGEKNPNYGKHLSDEVKSKISLSQKGKFRPESFRPENLERLARLSEANKGRYVKPETRMKLSIANKLENNPNWKGGISYEPYCPKFNKDLKIRIRAFFEYRCALCGKTTEENRGQLSCHHVTYNKEMCCDGKPVQFAAMCVRCHSKTGGKDRDKWQATLHRIIEEIYGGRSYFTKEEWKEVVECQITE